MKPCMVQREPCMLKPPAEQLAPIQVHGNPPASVRALIGALRRMLHDNLTLWERPRHTPGRPRESGDSVLFARCSLPHQRWHIAKKLDSRRSPSKTGMNALMLQE
jgi:hypothetical protein